MELVTITFLVSSLLAVVFADLGNPAVPGDVLIPGDNSKLNHDISEFGVADPDATGRGGSNHDIPRVKRWGPWGGSEHGRWRRWQPYGRHHEGYGTFGGFRPFGWGR